MDGGEGKTEGVQKANPESKVRGLVRLGSLHLADAAAAAAG